MAVYRLFLCIRSGFSIRLNSEGSSKVFVGNVMSLGSSVREKTNFYVKNIPLTNSHEMLTDVVTG